MEKYFIGDKIKLLTYKHGCKPGDECIVLFANDFLLNYQKTHSVYVNHYWDNGKTWELVAYKPYMIALKNRPFLNWIKYYNWKIKILIHGK